MSFHYAAIYAIPRVERFPSGQRDQTVNLTAQPSKVRILLSPPFITMYRDEFSLRCYIRNTRVERFPSGQRDQTVNLTAQPSKVRILLSPPFFFLFRILFVSIFSSSFFHIAFSIFKFSIALCVSVSRPDRFLLSHNPNRTPHMLIADFQRILAFKLTAELLASKLHFLCLTISDCRI